MAAAPSAVTLRIGVDVGGTFTDLAVVDDSTGHIAFHKVPSTPDDPSRAIAIGIRELLALIKRDAHDVGFLGHGTTVATNMVIERKGSRTGLITTRGFRDVLEIGRQIRPHLYDYRVKRPEPLVPRRRRLEVSERLAAEGTVLSPLDQAEVEARASELAAAGAEAVAICFIHAWRDPAHERAAREAVERVLPGAYISISADISPEFREFDRFSTTVLNAYVGPRVANYLQHLCDRVAAVGVPVAPYTIHSNGGLMSVATARLAPVRTCLSGPAAGVKGSAVIGAEIDFPDLVTFDVGGTSTDVSVVVAGATVATGARHVAGYPVRVPSIDIHVIGAGGGSVAWIDEGGALKVGPHSVGADPGPVAYGRGGTEATLTDANIVLGRLDPVALLRGRMKVDAAAARSAIAERIARPLNISVEDAALGIIRVAVANMGRAIRTVTTERGFSPERFALFAYGGAGPLHAADVAAECGIPTIVVPREPGTLCARGILLADVSLDFVRSRIRPLDKDGWQEATRYLAELRHEADVWLATERIPEARRGFPTGLDLRYQGQNHEVPVMLPPSVGSLEEVLGLFAEAHRQAYGYAIPGRTVELVNCRVTAVGQVPRGHPSPPPQGGTLADAIMGERKVFFGGQDRWCTVPVVDRDLLAVGLIVEGPAIIEEMSATLVVPPGQSATVDRDGDLVLRRPTAASAPSAAREEAHA
jgi:N-methylhydantoinase A